MFGSKITSTIKDKIKLYYYKITNIPNWCKNKILDSTNYYNDCKHKLSHLKETNFELGIDHLYKGNLNDAILRFKLVDKFFARADPKIYYWLALAYFLKNNYSTALDYTQKSSTEDKTQLGTFLQNYKNAKEIPGAIWQQYRDLTARYYTNSFRNENNIHLPYSFIHETINQITDLPDNYNILELGSNVGLIGYEIQKRFPESFSLTGVESSTVMNNLLSVYYPNTEIYDQVFDVSIPDFIKQTSDKFRPLAELAYSQEFEGDTERRTGAYSNVREDEGLGSTYKLPEEVELSKRSFDVILSFCGLSFTSGLEIYFDAIYSLLNESGYFAFCLPIAAGTSYSLKRKEFIFNLDEIIEILNTGKFTILSSQKLILAENNKYCIVVCKKTSI
ncbi:palindromic element RPE1 domain-containing protein [Rickettsia endosymbiont of Orchestes rusci]|uniref:palindromic element RPE1 domain-containing protein n=1 Tax=Rickettsia endosymbiont of Orchestes rusci TaxID=3066250 RepID=UPI00313D5312